jgi:hypothetical protein
MKNSAMDFPSPGWVLVMQATASLRPSEEGDTMTGKAVVAGIMAMALVSAPLSAASAKEGHPPTPRNTSLSKSKQKTKQGPEPGTISAWFESGTLGAGAIGYDERSGTLYGLYQLSSKLGTYDDFLDYLERAGHHGWVRQLREAGLPDTGTNGGLVPYVWGRIAGESPKEFADVQYAFIRDSLYRPALLGLRQATGIDYAGAPLAVREAIWSTAVQHGAAAAVNLFTQASREAAQKAAGETAHLLVELYSLRSGCFESSHPLVRKAVGQRLEMECELILRMLQPQS